MPVDLAFGGEWSCCDMRKMHRAPHLSLLFLGNALSIDPKQNNPLQQRGSGIEDHGHQALSN
jgi:hypothetical protein